MLAVEHAKRLADAGTEVLFVCFNRALSQHLRDRERTSGVGLLHVPRPLHASRQPRRKSSFPLPAGEAPPDYFAHELPDDSVRGRSASSARSTTR